MTKFPAVVTSLSLHTLLLNLDFLQFLDGEEQYLYLSNKLDFTVFVLHRNL